MFLVKTWQKRYSRYLNYKLEYIISKAKPIGL